MQENRINKTGIFQPQFSTVKNESSSILVENTLDKPGEGENLLMVANSTDSPTPANAAGLISYTHLWRCVRSGDYCNGLVCKDTAHVYI